MAPNPFINRLHPIYTPSPLRQYHHTQATYSPCPYSVNRVPPFLLPYRGRILKIFGVSVNIIYRLYDISFLTSKKICDHYSASFVTNLYRKGLISCCKDGLLYCVAVGYYKSSRHQPFTLSHHLITNNIAI